MGAEDIDAAQSGLMALALGAVSAKMAAHQPHDQPSAARIRPDFGSEFDLNQPAQKSINNAKRIL
jgi:hypothetical protein